MIKNALLINISNQIVFIDLKLTKNKICKNYLGHLPEEKKNYKSPTPTVSNQNQIFVHQCPKIRGSNSLLLQALRPIMSHNYIPNEIGF